VTSLPTGKRLQILGLLAEHGELTGGQLCRVDRRVSLARGTIYTTLERLDEVGLVTSRTEEVPGEGGPPRRYWQITAKGRRALKLAGTWQAVLATT
jgi:DNA-binding PadR family transcriptional regulator